MLNLTKRLRSFSTARIDYDFYLRLQKINKPPASAKPYLKFDPEYHEFKRNMKEMLKLDETLCVSDKKISHGLQTTVEPKYYDFCLLTSHSIRFRPDGAWGYKEAIEKLNEQLGDVFNDFSMILDTNLKAYLYDHFFQIYFALMENHKNQGLDASRFNFEVELKKLFTMDKKKLEAFLLEKQIS